jgi:hypothetical protein
MPGIGGAPLADFNDVRRIALSLPDTSEERSGQAFSVRHGGKQKAFAWVWLERIEPKKGRVPNSDVLGVRVASNDEKNALIAVHPAKFFTEPHYNGYPAVLVRLDQVDEGELEALLVDGWRCQAPRSLVKRFDG